MYTRASRLVHGKAQVCLCIALYMQELGQPASLTAGDPDELS